MKSSDIRNFQKTVLRHWKSKGRHGLPWRTTNDPYKILVSEIMLQQTQVDRVIPYYERFLKRFPTIRELSRSNLEAVLRIWSGLGYNRRAKLLRECAKAVVGKYDGVIPRDREALESLPGIGPYTAGAIRAFAFNDPDFFIETNIRTAYLYHFYSSILQKTRIDDAEILTIAEKAAEGQIPREWHWALMDYGAYLKQSGVKLNQRSAHHTKQSRFDGSLRQVRGALLRALSKGAKSEKAIRFDISNLDGLTCDVSRMREALRALQKDGMIGKRRNSWHISQD